MDTNNNTVVPVSLIPNYIKANGVSVIIVPHDEQLICWWYRMMMDVMDIRGRIMIRLPCTTAFKESKRVKVLIDKIVGIRDDKEFVKNMDETVERLFVLCENNAHSQRTPHTAVCNISTKMQFIRLHKLTAWKFRHDCADPILLYSLEYERCDAIAGYFQRTSEIYNEFIQFVEYQHILDALLPIPCIPNIVLDLLVG